MTGDIFALVIIAGFVLAIVIGLLLGYSYSIGVDKETAEELGMSYEEFKIKYSYKSNHSFWYYVFKR